MFNKLNFTDSELNLLLKEKFNCVKVQKGIKHIGIQPYFLNSISNGINETLNKIVSRYDKELKGIVLTYKNPKVLHSEGIIHNDRGQIYVDVEAEFYLFCPEENQIVKAIVNKTGQDHIGCLIHKVFNISVPRPPNDDQWIGRSVNIGDEILIKITFTDLFYIIPYIRGEIVKVVHKQRKTDTDYDSGICMKEVKKRKKEENHGTEVTSKGKKRRFSIMLDDDMVDSMCPESKKIQSDFLDQIDEVKNDSLTPKKIKKSRRNTISTEYSEFNIQDETVSEKKGKKKKKNKEKENKEFENLDSSVIPKDSLPVELNHSLNKSVKKKIHDKMKSKNLDETVTIHEEINMNESKNFVDDSKKANKSSPKTNQHMKANELLIEEPTDDKKIQKKHKKKPLDLDTTELTNQILNKYLQIESPETEKSVDQFENTVDSQKLAKIVKKKSKDKSVTIDQALNVATTSGESTTLLPSARKRKKKSSADSLVEVKSIQANLLAKYLKTD